MSQNFKNIYTIPPWESFVDVLAKQLLQEIKDPIELCNYIILLPNRRACREFMTSLVAYNHKKLLFEPMVFPFGDINLELINPELALSLSDREIITSSQRQALLMQLLSRHQKFTSSKKSFSGQAKQNAVLADKLASLIDTANWEGVPLINIQSIVPEDMAAHWEVVLDFLKIVYDFWPEILNEMNKIEASSHKPNIMNNLAQFWNERGSKFNIIAAGSTGSIPATAGLIKAVANLPNGRVFLPGLDKQMSDDKWDRIDIFHHQYNLKKLSQFIGVDRAQIELISDHNSNPIGESREALITVVLSPLGFKAESRISNTRALEDFNIIECQDPAQEAKLIALIMQEVIKQSDKTVALITPDRALVKRVNHELKRWDLRADDSGGNALIETMEADLIDKILEFGADIKNLNKFFALFKNGLIASEAISMYEQELNLQNLKLSPLEILQTSAPDLFAKCKNIFEEKNTLKKYLYDIIQVAENLVESIWLNENGIELRKILDDIIDNLELYPEISKYEFPEFLRYEISKSTVRVPAGFHPRLFIYGAIEARTQKADVVIMSGLNEGTWPASISSDPWLNRSMRLELALPLPEGRFGLSSHDFVQGFCAKEVYLTRSQKSAGAPTVPCRWFLKLKTYLEGPGVSISSERSNQLLSWARQLDNPLSIKPCSRPCPNPPVTVRPKKLSVTQIEKLITDPYSIYAYKILDLKPTVQDEASYERRIRGTIAHEILENVFTNQKEVTSQAIMELAYEKTIHHLPDSPRNKYWLDRFETTAVWLANLHKFKARSIDKIHAEIMGYIQFENGFTLTARADRIDQNKDGSVDIIDYKTGVVPTKTQVLSGHKPQVLLEALILLQGGFNEVRFQTIGSCEFWKIGGGKKPGEILDIPEIDADKIVEAQENLNNLISKYIFSNIPFYSIPRPLFAPVYNDYEHLARVKEWSKDMAA